MFAILRRRRVLAALSCAVFLVAIEYLTAGVGWSFRNVSLDVFPLGTTLGWLVFALTVLIGSWHVPSDVSGTLLVEDRESRYARAISVGVGLIALGWVISTVVIESDTFIHRFGLFLIPFGYLRVAAALVRLATKGASHSEHGVGPSYRVATKRMLVAAGFGVGLEAVAYVLALRGSPPWFMIFSYTTLRAAGIGMVAFVLLAAARRRMASSARLVVLGVGLLVVATGTELLGVAQVALPLQWRWPISLSLFLTGVGYFIVAVAAAFAAVRTKHPHAMQRRTEHGGRIRVAPEGLWVA